jgi:hypothetical protein
MKKILIPLSIPLCSLILGCTAQGKKEGVSQENDFELVKYNHPGAVSDLGVGLWAWPIPMDYDEDGDMDLLVSCPDKPFNGLYLFENASGEKVPVFEPPVRLMESIKDIQISYINKAPRVLTPGAELLNFQQSLDENKRYLFPVDSILKDFEKNPRFNQWKMVDYENDGDVDLVVGVDDWSDYGWDNAFDDSGTWANGPLHGYLYLIENVEGEYVNQGRIEAEGIPIDVYGAPSPNFADFDSDGDLDLICGEFLDQLTWFENIGTRERPEYSGGRKLVNEKGIITMNLEMIIPVAVDWDQDGHADLVVGDEDGRVALIRNTGDVKNRMPVFESPFYFQQKAENLKFGALVTPVSVDWDEDGDEDLVAGNSAGHIAFIENLDGGNPPRWATPELLKANGQPVRIQAGVNGSIQGPAEAKWGYTTLTVADWDGDGLRDIVLNSIWGKVEWLKNMGKRGLPELAAPEPVKVWWKDQEVPKPQWTWWDPQQEELATQWRTTPYAIDWNEDGLMDLIVLDQEGYLAYYEREEKEGERYLLPGKRIFYGENASEFDHRDQVTHDGPGFLRLNRGEAGSSGRRKFTFMDWDGDDDLDLLINSVNISLLENTGGSGEKVNFKYVGPVSDKVLAGHTTSPTFVDWDKNGVPDLLVGAEDGHFYYMKR